MDFSGPFLDVKPSNMLVNTRGQVKLCDFGVSTQVGLLFPPSLLSFLQHSLFYFQSTFGLKNHLAARQTELCIFSSAGSVLFIFNLRASFLHQNMIVHCLMTVKTADIVITTYE